MQDRIGPNRVGPWGLLQPLADGAKFLLKEDVIPDHVDKILFVIAPALAVMTSLMSLAVIPFGPTPTDPDQRAFIIAPGIDIGVVLIFAIGSLAVYAIILGGWASNNKYSLLGSMRASAQVISYEIPLGMSVLGVFVLSGSLNLETILNRQAEAGFFGWNVWIQPLAMLIFMASSMAESNRLPFDLPEAEQELVGGYHTEYSALKFGMFFLGEYTHMIVVSFLLSIIFFGGWHFPIIAEPGSAYPLAWLVKVLVITGKVACFILFTMFIRWTLPRFRFDQLMGLAWTVLIPLTLANLVIVMFVRQFGWPVGLLTISSVLLFAAAGYINAYVLQRNVSNRVRPTAQAAMLADGTRS
jgi:NADH-quinone oxidoreductase subunit H